MGQWFQASLEKRALVQIELFCPAKQLSLALSLPAFLQSEDETPSRSPFVEFVDLTGDSDEEAVNLSDIRCEAATAYGMTQYLDKSG